MAKLDVQPPAASSKVNVYYLENSDATDMAKVLDGVIKGMTAAAAPPGQPGAAAAPQTVPLRKRQDHHHPGQGNQFPGDHGIAHRLQ